jgi:hypothetical protein
MLGDRLAWFLGIRTLRVKNARCAKALILARFSLVRPGRTLRLLSCHRSVGGLRHASPALSFAKLPTQQDTQHVRQFE